MISDIADSWQSRTPMAFGGLPCMPIPSRLQRCSATIFVHYISFFLTDRDLGRVSLACRTLNKFVDLSWKERFKSCLPAIFSHLNDASLQALPALIQWGNLYRLARKDLIPIRERDRFETPKWAFIIRVLPGGAVAYLQDNCLCVWRANRLIRKVPQPAVVRDLVALEDGRLVAGDNSEVISVWDLRRHPPSKIQSKAIYSGHKESFAITCLVAMPGNRVLAGYHKLVGGRIAEWQVTSREIVHIRGFTEVPSGVHSLAALSENHIASGHGDGSLRIWDRVSGCTLRTFQAQSHMVNYLVPLLGGRLALCGYGGYISVWNLRDFAKPPIKLEHKSGSAVVDLSSTPNGRLLACYQTGEVHLWNVDHQTSAVIAGSSRQEIIKFCATPNGYCCAYDPGGIGIFVPDVERIFEGTRK